MKWCLVIVNSGEVLPEFSITTHSMNHWSWELLLFLLFGNDFGLNSYFLNFFNFYFLSRLVMTPHVLYVHMTYVYSFFICLCFSFHMITWPREVIIILWSFRLWSSILQMHPHPHFLLPLPPLHHHPYTHHQGLHSMGWPAARHS